MSFSLPRPACIRAIEIENARTKTFVLDAAVEATPGQFVMLWLPRLDEKPFSLVGDDPLTVTITRVGPFTQAVHELRVGDRLWWRGPLGHGFQIEGQRLLLVGGGYGAAPLVFLARRAVALGCEVTAALGASTADELLLGDSFYDLGVEVLITTEDGSTGQRGVVTDLVETLLAKEQADFLYGCGPEGMLTSLEELGRRYGIPTQLSWEAYIRCGMGLCGSCERDGKLVCQDGPVFTVDLEA
ncbi:MAG: dihydroorotate dehydrogenase electron transfer subunit [Chloroflexota bacterium]|nr:dihydroorotate dehydrogenase electron transfer subunit [Chloroflexota bacterium]